LTVRNNRFWGCGSTATLCGYQQRWDGVVVMAGSWNDAAHIFVPGDTVTQAVTGAKGAVWNQWTPMAANAAAFISRSTSANAFNGTNAIVADGDATKIWNPTSISTTRTWGGLHDVVIENNIIVNPIQYQIFVIYDLAPPFRMVNNTIVGAYYSAPTANRLGAPDLHSVAQYYAGDPEDIVVCSNVWACNVANGFPFPAGAVVTGNVMWKYKQTGGQNQLDIDWPGNKCYSATNDLDGIESFTTAGNIFVGGASFSNAFNTPAYDASHRIVVSGWTYSDWSHQLDLHAASFAVGYATEHTDTDFWGEQRDGDPDSGYDEYTEGGTPPTAASSPSPVNNALDVEETTDLSWTTGDNSPTHHFYWGTSRIEVLAGTGDTYKGEQAETEYDTGTMSYNTTYYWRIDEENDDGMAYGDVWTFQIRHQPIPRFGFIAGSVP
jgi:hypothetical protein